MRLYNLTGFGLVSITLLVACSSSDSNKGGGSGQGGSAQAGSGGAVSGTGGANSSCSCDITFNGVSKSVSCGQKACINGESFSCGNQAQVVDNGVCPAGTGGSSGGDTGGSGTGGSNAGGSDTGGSDTGGSSTGGAPGDDLPTEVTVTLQCAYSESCDFSSMMDDYSGNTVVTMTCNMCEATYSPNIDVQKQVPALSHNKSITVVSPSLGACAGKMTASILDPVVAAQMAPIAHLSPGSASFELEQAEDPIGTTACTDFAKSVGEGEPLRLTATDVPWTNGSSSFGSIKTLTVIFNVSK